MKASTVLNKLEKLVQKRKSELKKSAANYKRMKPDTYFNPKAAAERVLNEAARVNVSNVLGLKYLKTRNTFENYKNSCGVDMDTFEGHSYGWYSLTKKIKGTVYLNSYRYSNQTSKHISKVRAVFRALGISFKEIQAPRGLQDLKSALQYALERYGAAEVEFKYARKKYDGGVKYWKRQLKTLEALGFKASQRAMKSAIQSAETDRTKRNERNRIKRREKKFEAEMKTRITSASDSKERGFDVIQGGVR